jgi:hypothetical protein
MNTGEEKTKPEIAVKPKTEVSAPLPKSSDLESALQKLSNDKPKMMQEIMAMGIGTMGNPLQQKMTPEHITQVLNLAVVHDEREYNLTKQSNEFESQHKTSTRRYFFAAFVIICALTVLILILFKDKPEILIPCLTGLGAFVAGAAGGFGLGRQKSE